MGVMRHGVVGHVLTLHRVAGQLYIIGEQSRIISANYGGG